MADGNYWDVSTQLPQGSIYSLTKLQLNYTDKPIPLFEN